MFRGGLLKQLQKKSSVKIPAVRYFHFSCYKSMETLSCHSNETMSNGK